jgi:hypothetical protein
MHHLPTLFALIASSMVSMMAFGQIDASNPRYAGSGCPQDTASIVFAPDNSAISILYSEMNVTSDMPAVGRRGRLRPNLGGNGVSAGNRECIVDIDIRIPVGMQLELTSVDYRGFVDLPNDQSYATINSMPYFIGGTVDSAFGRMAGSQLIGGTSFIKRGPLTDSVFWQANYAGQSIRGNGFVSGKNISACRGQANLRIKTQTSTHTFDPSIVASLYLDSADAAFSAQYGLTLKPCDAENRKREKLCSRGSCPK